MYTNKSNLEVAVEAAARVDAVLAKKGKIKPNAVASLIATSNKTPGDLFSTEFEINDVPLIARNLLTKGITQEEINHFSGASISTRGRYISPEDKAKLVEPKSEFGGKKDLKDVRDWSARPLYLFIQGPNKQSLDLAIQRIDSLIREVMDQEINKFKVAQPPPLMTIQTSLPGIEKVLVGLENAPPSFNARDKVLGPGGANLQYISNETGVVVTLRGRGSGFPEPTTGQESLEPLHLCVEHQKYEVLQAGRQLAFNLIETIQQEFLQSQGQQPMPVANNLAIPQGQIQTVNLQPGEQLPPGMVTSISVPIYTQQPVNQIVNMPPPSMAVPPPQLLQQPPPQVPPQQLSLPPPGIHIPPHQGPLVPTQQGMVQQQLTQQPPHGIPPAGVVAQHPPAQQQVLVSQGGTVLNQPPPVVAGQQGAPVLTQQHQGYITHTTYPVQCIQANGQTIMAYPGMVRADGQAQLQLMAQPTQTQLVPQVTTTQAAPGLILQQGHPQQIQLAQLMPNHLGQPQAVTMLVQYQQQQPVVDPTKPPQQARLGLAVVQQQQRLTTPVQIQLQPGQQQIQLAQFQQPVYQQTQPIQYQQQLQPVQLQLQNPGPQLQPQVQVQLQPAPQTQLIRNGQVVQLRPPNPQEQPAQSTVPPTQQQSELTNQQQKPVNSNPQGQKRRFEADETKPGNYQVLPQPVPPPKISQQQIVQQSMPQQPQPAQQPPQPIRGMGNAVQVNSAQSGSGQVVLPPLQQSAGDKQQLPGGSDEWRNQSDTKPVNRGDGKTEMKRGRMTPNPGFEADQNPEARAANRGERPTFNHYSSKPQLYNANMPFHMHGIGMYPPPPPPPPPNSNQAAGGQYPFYPQQQPHPSHQYPYWMMHQN